MPGWLPQSPRRIPHIPGFPEAPSPNIHVKALGENLPALSTHAHNGQDRDISDWNCWPRIVPVTEP